jgi:arylamine N-acetyltransferase
MSGVAEQYLRYLRLLGIRRPPSGIEGLDEIVLRHLCRVPFENVSKLLLYAREDAGRVTALDEFLDGIEHLDLGGTCYTNNPFLAELLSALGYDADLLGADMSSPNVHTSIRVHLDSSQYHVDVGYGAPFRHPIRLDMLPHEIAHGGHRYVFDRTGLEDTHEMSVWSGQERLHRYVVHGPPRSREFFRQTVLDSYAPGKTFMTQVRITRFFENSAVELRNRTITYYRGGEFSRQTLNNLAELESAVQNDLSMPRCPIREAVSTLEHLTGHSFFESQDQGQEF